MARLADKEPQFMDLVGTDVADAADQEDTFDPGWRYEDRIGMRIWRIERSIGEIAEQGYTIAAGNNEASSWILTARNETAIPEMNSDGVIAGGKLHQAGITTSGTPIVFWEEFGKDFYPKGLLVVTDRLYLWLSNELGITQKIRLRIWYTTERLSDADYREYFEIWARA